MKKIIVFLLCLTMGTSLLFAQDIERNIKERLTDYFAKYTATAKISTPKLNSFDIDYDRRTIQIYASESFAYQPFLPETVETIYNQMKELLPGPQRAGHEFIRGFYLYRVRLVPNKTNNQLPNLFPLDFKFPVRIRNRSFRSSYPVNIRTG